MSQFGNLKHIVDLENLLAYKLSLIDFSSITNENIDYSWGNEDDLKAWIANDNKNAKGENGFYSIYGSDKTPINERKNNHLIWLVTPITGVNDNDVKVFDNVTIIVCSNVKESVCEERIPLLQAISDTLINKLNGSLRIKREDGVLQYSYMNRPKYAHSLTEKEKCDLKPLDLWDSVILRMDLLANNSCIKEDYFKICNN